ncbi:MAG: radical SAM protein [Clostridiales bacterium]|nr:radical SAM protein [Clostridiales bacterium]
MKIASLYLEITNQCNLDCRTCYNRSGQNRERRELSFADIEALIHRFLPLGLERLQFSGGEPTLHSEFDQILRLSDRYPQLRFSVVTNGTHLHRGLIDRLNAGQNFTLQLSLDGADEEQNAKTRGPGHFDQALLFAGQVHAPGRSLLKMVLSHDNAGGIETFYRLALSLGFVPEFAFLLRAGNGSERWEERTLSDNQKLDALRRIDSLNRQYGTEAVLPLCTDQCPYTNGLDNLSLCVRADGSFQPCQLLYDSRFSLGDIHAFDEDDFKRRLQALSGLVKKRSTQDYGCRRCLLRDSCGRGCPAAAVMRGGDLLDDDGDCGLRRLQFVGLQAGQLCQDKGEGGQQ